ncbi:hypothetical protein MPSEU_000106800 [Mayamaea pseudoterrestris]|nr:hypothetical protein MPSEU_000106800 [Mayamaea pseudoterrestris]
MTSYSSSFSFTTRPPSPIGAPQRRAIKLTDELSPRISQLGLEQWQQQVYGTILLNAYKRPSLENRNTGFEDERTIFNREREKVLELLEALELKELISLVKLAAWKSLCLSDPTTKLTTYYDFVAWSKDGWKSLKKKYEIHSAMETVVVCLAPFLKGKTEDSNKDAATINTRINEFSEGLEGGADRPSWFDGAYMPEM